MRVQVVASTSAVTGSSTRRATTPVGRASASSSWSFVRDKRPEGCDGEESGTREEEEGGREKREEREKERETNGVKRKETARKNNDKVTRGKSEKEKWIYRFACTGATPFSALFPLLAYSRNEVLRQGWKYVTISR